MEHFVKRSKVTQVVVEPGETPVWTEELAGETKTFRGHFSVYRHGGMPARIPGIVVERVGRPSLVLLHSPPSWLLSHPVAPCLQLYKPQTTWFKLHWEQPATTFSESCAFVERVLHEAWEAAHGK